MALDEDMCIHDSVAAVCDPTTQRHASIEMPLPGFLARYVEKLWVQQLRKPLLSKMPGNATQDHPVQPQELVEALQLKLFPHGVPDRRQFR